MITILILVDCKNQSDNYKMYNRYITERALDSTRGLFFSKQSSLRYDKLQQTTTESYT